MAGDGDGDQQRRRWHNELRYCRLNASQGNAAGWRESMRAPTPEIKNPELTVSSGPPTHDVSEKSTVEFAQHTGDFKIFQLFIVH